MKIDFFDKLFGNKEVEKKRGRTLGLNEVIGLLEKEREERSEKSRKEAKPIIEKISFALFEIRTIAEGMKEKKLDLFIRS